MWNENLPVIEESLGDYSNTAFSAVVPIEILVPLDPNDRAVARRFSTQLAAICDARNNNAQLKDDTKMNRSGYFDYLRSTLPEPLANSVQWKSNTRGRINTNDIVAFAWLPLMSLNIEGMPKFSPNVLYSGKKKVLAEFRHLMDLEGITVPNEDDLSDRSSDIILVDKRVKSDLNLTENFARLYDLVHQKFPETYNHNGGNYGNITTVREMNIRRPKTHTEFFNLPLDTDSPKGYLMPVLYAFTALLDTDENGCVYWKYDAEKFLNDHLPTLVRSFRMQAMDPFANDPQKCGKSAAVYVALKDTAMLELLKAGDKYIKD